MKVTSRSLRRTVPSARPPLAVLITTVVLAAAVVACQGESGQDRGQRPARASSQGSGTPAGSPSSPPSSATRQDSGSGGVPVPSYAEVVSRVAPAVVTIHSARRVRAPRQFPFFSDPFLREFFGGRSSQAPPRGEVRGLGSGVIVAADGVCLTNHHVIDGAEQITVELTDRRTFEAELVGSDPPSDLAVLKIGATNLPTLTLGDSERVRVGDVALAIGNPLGVGQTVTAGIISAKGRYTGLSDGSFEDFLQTDAPINQGNSGGALVNGVGELVGINSQILSTSGGNIGIGFAIPSNMARNVMQQLIENRRVRRGMLGVVVEPITPEIAKRTNRSDVRGVLVRDVVSGGPADKAGIRPGDIVLAINGTPIEDANSLRNQVANSQPGSQGTLTVWRDGREQQIRVTFGELEMPERRT